MLSLASGLELCILDDLFSTFSKHFNSLHRVKKQSILRYVYSKVCQLLHKVVYKKFTKEFAKKNAGLIQKPNLTFFFFSQNDINRKLLSFFLSVYRNKPNLLLPTEENRDAVWVN